MLQGMRRGMSGCCGLCRLGSRFLRTEGPVAVQAWPIVLASVCGWLDTGAISQSDFGGDGQCGLRFGVGLFYAV
jgi:hypothetical protein